ncbi:MAG: ribonuclease HII [Victivallaceae bacterium]
MNAYLANNDELLLLERKLWSEGFVFVAGIDEAGRGPLAGPVVAAAVCFNRDEPVPRVFDSKQVTERDRLAMREAILSAPGVRYAVIEVGPERVDELNILRATDLAMREAALALGGVDFLLVDGRPVPYLPKPSKSVVGGDAKSASIAAASILAKVYRDELMVVMAGRYPGYGFELHKGYGTAMHLEALRRLGPCAIHRKSFGPVRDLIEPPPEQPELF